MPPLKVFKIKRGDLLPNISAILGDIEDGEVVPGSVDLTGASVVFNMRNESNTLVVNRGVAVVDDPDTGEVHYAWQSGDTDVSGRFKGEFEATKAGKPMTFPNDGYLVIVITDDLG